MVEMERLFTIGELACRAGVNIQTVHYYERLKLFLPLGRKESGYRLYNEESLKKLRFIRRAKEIGFTLEEIKGLLDLNLESSAACGRVKERATSKLKDVKEKIKALESVMKILNEMIDACNKRRPTDKCPVVKIMEEEESRPRTRKGKSI